MGKQWDKAVPHKEVWIECLRVLKPGAFMFCMSLPRQDVLSRMIVNIEDAGFNVAFPSIYHTFASGFPKALSISKVVDKLAGAKREVIKIESSVPERPITKNWNASFVVPKHQGSFFDPTICGGLLREVTASATPEAKALEGFYAGYSPKPCLEVIIVAMRPLEHSTYVAQALDNGKGCTNLDAGRIPFESEEDIGDIHRFTRAYSQGEGHEGWKRKAHDNYTASVVGNKGGRFAPHLLVEDDVLNDNIIHETHSTGKHSLNEYPVRSNTFRSRGTDEGIYRSDEGSFSRYFSLDVWWDACIKELPEEVQKTFPFLIVPKENKASKNKGLKGFEKKHVERIQQLPDGFVSSYGNVRNTPAPQANYHPTVKSLKLISYLITIVSRECDTILDPYVGSGTTLVAAEMLKRNAIGIDISPEYCNIAYHRLSNECRQIRLDSNPSIIEKVGF
jgi:site-specific DNA-methyltransferase (adenine-specific)